jgi:hypothetical protein
MKNALLLLFALLLSASIAAQCLQLNNCPAVLPVCDETANDAQLWHENYWWDAANQTTDLSDAPTTLSAAAFDVCPGALITARYLLYLDLDADGTFETVVKSWEPPAPGTVQYNNGGNPNFEGGETRIFDQRPVAAGQKYQFAIETSQQNDTLTARLRWNTPDAPSVFADAQLPAGYHKIKWIFENNQGEQRVCEYGMPVKDCVKPTVVCLNGLAVNIMPTGLITLWAVDFLQYMVDNQTPSQLLQLGIRKSGAGSGFPEDGNGAPINNVTFDCGELGTQLVELWSRDAAGNADFCQTFVIVQDNFQSCGNNGGDDAPNVVCINGLSANILPSEQVQLWASDFLLYVEDDNTPANDIELGIRKTGTGTGFPEDGNGDPVQHVIYQCDDLGTQTIELWARDMDGHVSFCETYVIVQDNIGHCGGSGGLEPPKVVCLNGLSANLLPTGQLQLWVTDFLQYVEDDVTPAPQIQLGIRHSGTGTGFPEDGDGNPVQSLIFDCDGLGTRLVEVWARDLDGMVDYCETYVVIQDNAGHCDNNGAKVTTCIVNACSGAPLLDAGIVLNDVYSGDLGGLDSNGCALFPVNGPIGTGLTIAPVKDDFPLNGVTVFDLIKIKRIILGVDLDASPYALIAADANKSGTITGFDMIELRKLMLGLYDELPDNTSWRFIDDNFVFPNPQNPFQTAFPETILIPNAQAGNYSVAFKAVKIGDLDCDAWLGLQAPAEGRDRGVEFVVLQDAVLQEGDVIDLPLSLSTPGPWDGLQLGLDFDPQKIKLLEYVPGAGLMGETTQTVHQPSPGNVRCVWLNEQDRMPVAGEPVFYLRVQALAPVTVSKEIKLSSTFGNLGSRQGAPYALALRFEHPVQEHFATSVAPPQPNPTTGSALIALQMARSGKVQLEIAEPGGKIIWSEQSKLDAGPRQLYIPASALSEAGIFVWRLRTEDRVFSGKIVRI